VPTSLVLVRHGEARAGVEHFVGGPNGCKGLTDRGRRQARQLRDRLASSDEIVPDVVLSSTLRRAVETAEIVSTAFPARQPLTDCDYCEQHVGESDGLTMEEYERQYGVVDFFDPERVWSPGGESPRTFDERVRRATAALLEQHAGQTVMLFTHGGFVFGAVMFLLGAPGIHERSMWNPPGNTSLTVFVSGRGDELLLDRYNDVAHLTDG
jgi:2,3-bisphosphoglycerate-dependent phosphoglycerate mutase